MRKERKKVQGKGGIPILRRLVSLTLCLAMLASMVPSLPWSSVETAQALTFSGVTMNAGAEVYINGNSTGAVSGTRLMANTTSDAVNGSDIATELDGFIGNQYGQDSRGSALLSDATFPSAANITSWKSYLSNVDKGYWLSNTGVLSAAGALLGLDNVKTRAYRTAANGTGAQKTITLSGKTTSGAIYANKTASIAAGYDLESDLTLNTVTADKDITLWNTGSGATVTEIKASNCWMDGSELRSWEWSGSLCDSVFGAGNWSKSDGSVQCVGMFGLNANQLKSQWIKLKAYNSPACKDASAGDQYASHDIYVYWLYMPNIYVYNETTGTLTRVYSSGDGTLPTTLPAGYDKFVICLSDTSHWGTGERKAVESREECQAMVNSGKWVANGKDPNLPQIWLPVKSFSGTKVKTSSTCEDTPYYETGIGVIKAGTRITGSSHAAGSNGVRPYMTLDTGEVAFARESTSGTDLTTGAVLGSLPVSTLASGSSYKLVAKDSSLAAPTVDTSGAFSSTKDGSTSGASYDAATKTIKVAPGTRTVTIPVSAGGNYVSALANGKSGSALYNVVGSTANGSGTVTIDLDNLVDTSTLGNTATISLYTEQANAAEMTDGISADALTMTVQVAGYEQTIDFTDDTKTALADNTYAYGETFTVSSYVKTYPSETDVSKDAHKDIAITYTVDANYLEQVGNAEWNSNTMESRATFRVIRPFNGSETSKFITIKRAGCTDASGGGVMLEASAVNSTAVNTRKREIALTPDPQAKAAGQALPAQYTWTLSTEETYGGYTAPMILNEASEGDTGGTFSVSVEKHLHGNLSSDTVPADGGKILDTASGNIWQLKGEWDASAGLYDDFYDKYSVTFGKGALSVSDKSTDSTDKSLRITANDFWMKVGDYQSLTDSTLIEKAQAQAFLLADPFTPQTVTVASNGIKAVPGIYQVAFSSGSGAAKAQTTVNATLFDEITEPGAGQDVRIGANNATINVGTARTYINADGSPNVDGLKALCSVQAVSSKTGASVDLAQVTVSCPDFKAKTGTYPATFTAGNVSVMVNITVSGVAQVLTFDDGTKTALEKNTYAYGDTLTVTVEVDDPATTNAGVNPDRETPVTYTVDIGYLEPIGEAVWNGNTMKSTAAFRVIKPFPEGAANNVITVARAANEDNDGNYHEAATAVSPQVLTRKREIILTPDPQAKAAGEALPAQYTWTLSTEETYGDYTAPLILNEEAEGVKGGPFNVTLDGHLYGNLNSDTVPADGGLILDTASGNIWQLKGEWNTSAANYEDFNDKYEVTLGTGTLSVSDKSADSKDKSLRITANDFWMKVSDYQSLTDNRDSTLIEKAQAQAFLLAAPFTQQTVTVASNGIKAAPGIYQVAFSSGSGAAKAQTTVNANLYDEITENPDRGERIGANSFAVSVEEAKTLTGDTAIRLAHAKAESIVTGKELAVTADISKVAAEKGTYQVTFSTEKGTAVTVTCRVTDYAAEDKENQERLTANDFAMSVEQVTELLKKNAAGQLAELVSRAGAAAVSTMDGSIVDIVKADTGLKAQRGLYKVTFETAKGTKVQVTCTVTDAAAENPEKGEYISANNFYLTAREAQTVTLAFAVGRANASAAKIADGSVVEITGMKGNIQMRSGSYPVTFFTEAGTGVTVTATVMDNRSWDEESGEALYCNNFTVGASDVPDLKEGTKDSLQELIRLSGAVAVNEKLGTYVEILYADASELKARNGTYTVVFATEHVKGYADATVTGEETSGSGGVYMPDEEETYTGSTSRQMKKYNLIARSSYAVSPTGKQAILIKWRDRNGLKLKFDGVEIYRSTKRFSGFGKKPIFVTSLGRYYNTQLKGGVKYYYKVRGYVKIDGRKYYTSWSTKAFRIAKTK